MLLFVVLCILSALDGLYPHVQLFVGAIKQTRW